MLTIKLIRTGKKNAPSYRLAVGEPSRVVEYLGTFNPQNTPPLFQVDKEKIQAWVKKGAHLTPAVGQLLKGKYVHRAYVAKKEGAEAQEAAAEASKTAPAPIETPASTQPENPESKKEESPAAEIKETPKEEPAAPAKK